MATYAAYRHVELDKVGYGKKRVLKPPGGGSSDIFGGGSKLSSPRKVKQHQQSQLGACFFNGAQGLQNPSEPQLQSPSSNGSSAPETPRSKPGNDSYKRLFGPPDARPPSTPNSKYHMRSTISLSSESSADSLSASSSVRNQRLNGNGDTAIDGTNGYHHNDVVDGNPVTGTGYDNSSGQQNGSISGSASSAGSEKSSTDSSPVVMRMKNRVPPGGFSSGLW